MKSGTKDSQQYKQSSIFAGYNPTLHWVATSSLTFHSLHVELEVSAVTGGGGTSR